MVLQHLRAPEPALPALLVPARSASVSLLLAGRWEEEVRQQPQPHCLPDSAPCRPELAGPAAHASALAGPAVGCCSLPQLLLQQAAAAQRFGLVEHLQVPGQLQRQELRGWPALHALQGPLHTQPGSKPDFRAALICVAWQHDSVQPIHTAVSWLVSSRRCSRVTSSDLHSTCVSHAPQ